VSEVIVGVDLGGTNLKTAVVSLEKQVLAKDSRSTHADQGPEAVMEVMEQAVHDVLQKSGRDKSQVLAVGFGIPGPVNWQEGLVYTMPNLPGWDHVPLAQRMQERIGVPCYLDNDANAACYGEYWMGAGQGTDCMAVLTLGTGVGGGIVVFGQLLRGIDGTAAELGHLKVQRNGRLCGCGSYGCLETYASVTGMVRTAVKGLDKGKDSILKSRCNNELDKITGKMIFEAAQQGDAYAIEVFQETANWLGLGIASLINLLNPEKIVLCGGMIAAGDLLFTPVRETARANSFETPGKRCEIVPAGLGADSGVLGSAGCAFARLNA
jgi:glucokinase